jgi:Acetyltransferase (GNAT) domain
VAIRYLKYNAIDKNKWDACIARSGNGLIYGYSYYLDTMCRHWDGLIDDDYAAVMPLTFNKKFGFYYLYQPAFTAALGVFGQSVTAEKLTAFLNTIPAKFRYWDFYLNYANCFAVPGYTLYERMNFILLLNDTYENLYARFRDNIKRNLKKCGQNGLFVKTGTGIKDIILLSKVQAAHFSDYSAADFDNIENLYTLLHEKKKAVTYGVYTPADELLASAAFFFDGKRAYYILVGNSANGKTLGASHALLNAFIKDHANTDMILDFEGSDLDSLAFFYSSFGSSKEKYCGIKKNNLPFWAKWFKK